MESAIRFGIYRSIFIIVFICGAYSLKAQEFTDKQEAYIQISLLKRGALVVRLRTNEKKIELYQNAGKTALADELKAKQKKQNIEIIKAFKEAYTYSAVYFIYAEDYTKLLIDGQASGYFLNEDLEIDSSIVFSDMNYFFCDFGPVYAEVISNPNDPKNKVVSSSPAFQEALVIKDYDMVQLLSPFPFYAKVRFYEFEDAVERLNNDLFKFYAKVMGKEKNDED
ncbi:MAG: hypothetical protein LRY27_03795 [Chitinophagales bacterium]|nr:hypothetical protein [Chitinophagales bacterium]